MSSSAASSLLRNLIRELRHTNRTHQPFRQSPSYQFIVNQFRKNQVTPEQTCKAAEEAQYLADTYLCYLKSTRKGALLRSEFHGLGERSIRQTADMVGFKLPHDPK